MNDPEEIDDFSLSGSPIVIDESKFKIPKFEMPHWHELFKFDLYDWDDPEFIAKNRRGKYAYRVIRLTQGYFTIVSVRDYRRMTQFENGSPKKWRVQVNRYRDDIMGVYARRPGRGSEPNTVFMHRELVGCLGDSGVADHINGYGLDNRFGTPKNPINLRYTGRSENGHNVVRKRDKNPHGLQFQGTEKRGERFGGKICKRVGKSKKVVTTRSIETWETEEEAYEWYKKQLESLHGGRNGWAHDKISVNWPIFPPRLDSDISPRSKQLREGFKKSSVDDDIPF